MHSWTHSSSTAAGVALGKCVEYGQTFAGEVANYLRSDGKAGKVVKPEDKQDEAFYQGEVAVAGTGALK